MLEFRCLWIDEYENVVSMIFFTLVVFWFLSGDDKFKRIRSQDYNRWYQKKGILCGGVVTDRKYIEGRLYIQYAYRLPNYPATAYIKDFVEAPTELKANVTNIVVVLVPRYSMSGIHYGILQKLNDSTRGASRAMSWFLWYALFQIGYLIAPDYEPSSILDLPRQILFYCAIYQMWRLEKRVDKTSGVTQGVWKTLKRRKSRPSRLRSILWEPSLKPDEMERKANEEEEIFLALDRVEHDFVQIMNSLDPNASGSRVTTFSCKKYFSFASVSQEALQKDSAQLNA